MVRVACPRCHHVIDADPAGLPTCPTCGFTGEVGPTPPPSSFRIGARQGPPPPVPETAPPYAAPWPAHAPSPAYAPVRHPTGGTNTKALIALIAGVLGLTIFPVIASIVAVILGPIAKQELRNDPSQTGDGMATAAIILGWISIGITLLLMLLVFPALFMFAALL